MTYIFFFFDSHMKRLILHQKSMLDRFPCWWDGTVERYVRNASVNIYNRVWKEEKRTNGEGEGANQYTGGWEEVLLEPNSNVRVSYAFFFRF